MVMPAYTTLPARGRILKCARHAGRVAGGVEHHIRQKAVIGSREIFWARRACTILEVMMLAYAHPGGRSWGSMT